MYYHVVGMQKFGLAILYGAIPFQAIFDVFSYILCFALHTKYPRHFLSANDYVFLPRRWGAHVVSSLCLALPARNFQNLSPDPVHGHVKSLQPQKK